MTADRPLRVHVLIDSLTWGGAETLLTDFAIGAPDAGIELSVGYLNERSAAAGRLREVGIEPALVPIQSLLRKADRELVRRHIADVGPDLLHTHLGYSDFHGGLAARALGVPTVATLHVMHWGKTLRERTKARIIALARRRCAHRVIAVSDAARGRYLETGWDLPERVITIHNGIVGSATPGVGGRVREELGIAHDERVVVMVSVLRRGKGHDIAARAVELLRDAYPRLRLVALGEGPDRAEIYAALARLGDRALMPGHRDDVLGVLDAADVLIHPSSFDAFPTALLEAGAAGVPAIATNVGGIPEIVSHGENGLLIDPPPTATGLATALDKLLGDSGLRARMGERGRKLFQARFTVDHWMHRLIPVYQQAMRAQAHGDHAEQRSGDAATARSEG